MIGSSANEKQFVVSRIPARTVSQRSFCLLLTIILLRIVALAEAQQAKEVFRIGYFSANESNTDSQRAQGIRLALRNLGYVEGQKLTIDFRYASNKRDRLRPLATELVNLKVDAIVVAGGDNVLKAAMDATKTIPLVLVGVGSDPVEVGFVTSLARPGGNVTGVTSLNRELGGKRLELLKETVPIAGRVAVLYDPATPGTAREVKEDLPSAARALGLTLRPWEVRDANGFDMAFDAIRKERPDGLYVTLAGEVIRPARKQIAAFALKSRLASVYDNAAGVEAGGLLYYGAALSDIYRRVATYVDRILKGAKPADLPIEQPTKFELVINLKTAKQIGLTIPPDVLARTNRVIK